MVQLILPLVTLAATATAQFSFGSGGGGGLTSVSDFGTNPTRLSLDVYAPSGLKANPSIILAIHMCTGSGKGFSQELSALNAQAASRNFVVLYPTTTNDGKCWDAGTPKSLTRNGGGDSTGLVNMVNWALKKYNGNPKKVFAIGESSGAMMTNVLAGVYPDVFAAGSVFSGVGPGCMATKTNTPKAEWGTCCGGKLTKTAAQWGAQVRAFDPGYNGPRPKMQIWHGTADTTLRYQVFSETLKAWSDVLGVQFTRNATSSPQSGYTQLIYGDGSKLVGYSAQGVGHTVPPQTHITQVLQWFGV